MPIRPPDRLIARLLVAGVLLGSLASCARRGACTGDYCGTVVIAAAGEPDILLPPVTELSTSRDVYDQLFLKLADLGMSGNTIGDEDFQPQLADRKSTRLNSSHVKISYAVFCLKKKIKLTYY